MRVLRHLRRVLDAACRGARAGRREAARARRRALAPGPHSPRDDVAAAPRSLLGISAPGSNVGPMGAQERWIARGLSRAQIALRHGYDQLRSAAPSHLGSFTTLAPAGRFAR